MAIDAENEVQVAGHMEYDFGHPSFKLAKRLFEVRYCEQLLFLTGGNVAKASRIAGKDRSDFHVLIRRLGVDPNRWRQ